MQDNIHDRAVLLLLGATYQRLMDRVLAPMLGRNVQAYVDDMVVTSQQREQHVANPEELFVRMYGLKREGG